MSTEPSPPIEVTLATALELVSLGLATMVDIRQNFELEMKGRIPDTVHIPMFEVKRMLGQSLSEDEQDILDAGTPKEVDIQGFVSTLNRLHHAHDHIILCICNSGRRSIPAAELMRALGYRKALSVAGGFQAWKKLQAAQPAAA